MGDVEKLKIGNTTYNIADATARASIPTKTSQLTNDSNFVSATYESIGDTASRTINNDTIILQSSVKTAGIYLVEASVIVSTFTAGTPSWIAIVNDGGDGVQNSFVSNGAFNRFSVMGIIQITNSSKLNLRVNLVGQTTNSYYMNIVKLG